MKKTFIITTLLTGIAFYVFGQKVDVDQAKGLVKVDGADKFYLAVTNNTILSRDFILENLDHEELAYLKYENTGRKIKKEIESPIRYLMYFPKTGNHCYISGFTIAETFMKHIAVEIAKADLVKDGKINQDDEQRFVVLHDGSVAIQSFIPAAIVIKEGNIYNNMDLVGSFSQTTDSGMDKITFYNRHKAMICSAIHEHGNDAEDWVVNYQKRTITVLYNKDAQIEKLSAYLVDNGIL